MNFAKCDCGTLLSDSNVYTHYKIIHKLQNGLITEAVRRLEFRPMSEINRNGNNGNNNNISSTGTISTTTNNGEDFYQKRQEYWERREKIIDERWKETKKWQQEIISCLAGLRDIVKGVTELNNNNNTNSSNNHGHYNNTKNQNHKHNNGKEKNKESKA